MTKYISKLDSIYKGDNMTRQEVRDELKKYKSAKTRYMRTKRELEELETLIESVSVDYSKPRVKSTPKNDNLANSVDRLYRLHRQIVDDGNDAIDAIFYVTGLIDKVIDEKQKDILHRRYVDLDYWEGIARDTNYSIARVHQIETKGLDAIKRILENS